mgnify:CR=1 FL=1
MQLFTILLFGLSNFSIDRGIHPHAVYVLSASYNAVFYHVGKSFVNFYPDIMENFIGGGYLRKYMPVFARVMIFLNDAIQERLEDIAHRLGFLLVNGAIADAMAPTIIMISHKHPPTMMIATLLKNNLIDFIFLDLEWGLTSISVRVNWRRWCLRNVIGIAGILDFQCGDSCVPFAFVFTRLNVKADFYILTY